VKRVLRGGWVLGWTLSAVLCLGQSAENPRQTALALEQQGRNAEAEAAWRAVLKTHPSNPEPYAHLGLLEARQEHYKEAVPLYRKALALDPSMPGLRLNLGLALFKAGQMKEAIQIFVPLRKGLSAASPEAQRLTVLIGMAHYGLGEYAEAAPFLKEAAAADAQNLPLRLALAHSCMWSKQFQCVMDTYREILNLNAESAEADMLAGEALDELKDHTGAIAQFRAAVKANPREPLVHFGLGYLLWTQHQYPEAVSEFQAELANSPDDAQALLYLGDAEMQMSHPELGLEPLQKSVRLDPGQELAHLDLGIVYADSGHPDEALAEMKEAVRLAPSDVNAHWRLGRLYRSMGKKAEAKAEFDQASSLTRAVDDALAAKMGNGRPKPATAQTPPGK